MKEGGVDLEEKLRRRKIAMGFTDRRAFTADAAGAARALSADGTAGGDDGDGERAVNSGRDGLQKYASTGGIFAASALPSITWPQATATRTVWTNKLLLPLALPQQHRHHHHCLRHPRPCFSKDVARSSCT